MSWQSGFLEQFALMLFVLITYLFVLCCVVVLFQVCAAHSDQLDFLGQDHRRGRRPEEDDRQHPIPHQVNGRAKINQHYKKSQSMEHFIFAPKAACHTGSGRRRL